MQLSNKRSANMRGRIIRRRHWLPVFLGFVVLAACARRIGRSKWRSRRCGGPEF